MEYLRRIIDFIGAWLYYPRLKEYMKRTKSGFDIWGSRWNYAKWHCRYGKLKECNSEPEVDKFDWWKNAYNEEPIEN